MLDKSGIVARTWCFSGAHDPEMCVVWANKFLTNDETLDEEIEQIQGTISNERLWEKGASGETAVLHSQNIQNLISYLAWLESFK